MDEELTMLKKSLISLVVSSPTTMTVSSLLKDYRSMIGGWLPLAKYGYKEPVQFLRERCSDIFVIEGPSWDPILTPKVTKNLAHIDQMVQRQKVQCKYKGKRRSVVQPNASVEAQPNTNNNIKNSCNPQNRHSQSNRYSNTQNNSSTNKYNNKPTVVSQSEINTKPQIVQPKPKQNYKENDYKSKLDSDYNNTKQSDIKSTSNNNVNDGSDYVQTSNKENEDKSNYGQKCNRSSNTNEDMSNNEQRNSTSSALSKFYKKRLPQYNSDMDFPSPDLEQTSKSSTGSGEQSSTSSSSKQALLEELKSEIMAIIKDSPDGVWCTDLMNLYKERYGRELRFSRFGHTRLVGLVYSLPRVEVVRPTPDSDWLLLDRSSGAAPTPEPRHSAPRAAPAAPPAAPAAPPAAPADEDDALPGVDFDRDVFPADCLHYVDSLPATPVPPVGAALAVLLGEVYSPSHFWLLPLGDDHDAMQRIMDDMNEYYGPGGAGEARVLARGALRVGQLCAALYEGDWHRALVVRLLDSDTVKVRHVDYGTVESVAARALRPLLRAWGALPAQAVRARLAGARPAAGGWRWPRAACAWFLARVRERRLYAHVHAADGAAPELETFLIDTAGPQDACLTRELLRVGHADARADSALHSEDCYLYPRFEALESGAAPNYGDICRMLADGIAPEYVDEYRRHVPGPWARPPAPAPDPAPAPPRAPREVQVSADEWAVSSTRPPAPVRAPLEVQLSAGEWAVLSKLRGADPGAARWYMLSSACRNLMPPPPGF